MLQHSIDLPQNQGQIPHEKQMGGPFDQYSITLQKSINLPDFQVSQVIAKNQVIDVKCEEDKPFENFFLRANELGYDAHLVTHQTIELDDLPSIKYEFNEENNIFQNLAPPSRTTSQAENKINPIKKIIVKKLQKIAEVVFEFDIIRIQIWDYLSQIKQKLIQEFRNYNNEWSEVIANYQKYFRQIYQKEIQKGLKLEHQIELLNNKIEQLQFGKNNVSLEQLRWKEKIEELQVEIKQLKNHLGNLSTENDEMKFELAKINQYQSKISNYQNELHNLTINLEQNSEYIFDLQQKIANNNFEIAEKEQYFKKQYEIALQQQRQKIQHNFTSEFEKVQEDIKEKVMEQLYHQYKNTMDNLIKEHQVEVEDLKRQLQEQQNLLESQKNHYEIQISHLEQEKMGLIEQTKEYESKLHEFQQIQIMTKYKPKQEDKLKIQQLSIKLREIQQKCRDKEAQLHYYKSMKSYPHDSIINCRPKKPGNILVLDESILDKSILKQSAISPSSALNQKFGKSREVLINNILSRIRMRQEGSIVSQLNQNSFESKNNLMSTLRPVSPESMLLEKEKDVRMKNISTKLQQLRSDIRREIGMMKN